VSEDVKTKSIKLVGGPSNGVIMDIPEDDEFVTVAFWQYGIAGAKEDGHHLFALFPRSRVRRRLVMWYIEKFGKHPGLAPRTMPYVKRRDTGRNEPCHCNSGVKFKRCCGR